MTFAPDPDHPHDPTKMRQVGPMKVDMEGFDGAYKKLGEPEGSEPYGLKKLEEPDQYGNTHYLKNQEHFWAGTEEQFKKEFEK